MPDRNGYRSAELEQAIAAGMPPCTNCHGQNVRRSHTSGLLDSLLSIVRYAPFRCRVCQHRFYNRPPKAQPDQPPVTGN
jgi:hypothetical protein